MNNRTRTMTTGKGIHARRRVAISSRQPLKPRYSAHRSAVLLVAFVASLGLLAQQNHERIGQYINRPVVKVRMEAKWQELSEAEIRKLLTGFMGKGFFEIDVDGVKQRLEQHPWVAQASVKRLWPDTLALEISEHIAIAKWGETELLNQYGEIFKPSAISGQMQLPQLQGPFESQFLVMQQYQKFSQVLFPSGLRLTELELSSRGSWELTLNEAMHVAVGRSDLSEKLERFVKFYDSQPKTSSALFDSIDLRYGNGIAVKSREPNFTGVAAR